jgi:hypothetical protein
MKVPDVALGMALLGMALLGMALGAAGAVVVEELPDEVDGEAGACAKAGAANIVAMRQAAICVLSMVNSFWKSVWILTVQMHLLSQL